MNNYYLSSIWRRMKGVILGPPAPDEPTDFVITITEVVPGGEPDTRPPDAWDSLLVEVMELPASEVRGNPSQKSESSVQVTITDRMPASQL